MENEILQQILTKLNTIEQGQGELRQDVTELKQDVTVLKQDVTELKHDVTVLKHDVTEIKQDVAVLKHDVTEIKQDVTVLKQDVTELKQGQTRLEIILETETNKKINLLVECQQGIIDKLDSLPEKIAGLQDNTVLHGVAIKELSRRTANIK